MLPTPAEAIAYQRQVILAAPVAIAVPVVLGAVILALGRDLSPLPMVVGAVGWGIAYLLRGPVAIVLRRRGDRQLESPWFVAASGPAEELVRLAIVLILGRDLDTALSIGLGWAAIEVVFAIVSGLALATLLTREDEEAERIRTLLPAPPGGLGPSAPWWGVWERIWASALHLAFTAIVAYEPALVIATIVVHSATNLLTVRALDRWSMARVELAGAAWAAVVVGVAAVLWMS